MLRHVLIARHQRGFYYRNGDFARLLGPGSHWLLWTGRCEVKIASQLAPRLDLPGIEVLAQVPEVEKEIHAYRIQDTQRGLLFRDGNFAGFLGPGYHAFLRGPVPYTVEVVSTDPIEISHRLRDVLARSKDAQEFIGFGDVPPGHKGLLFLDQVLSRTLEPGRYYFWRGVKEVRITTIDMREQALEVQGQELMTQDKVSLRINLSTRFQVTDPVRAYHSQASFRDALYRDLQLALRDEVGGRTLDDLLSRKEETGQALLQRTRPGAEGMGVALLSAGVRDIILPGEMRAILNQVIEAEKRAQANMIARREETAATRNLLNTAKLLENNPLLLHLKELESTERIAEKIGSLSVYGGLDGLLAALQGIARYAPKAPPAPGEGGDGRA